MSRELENYMDEYDINPSNGIYKLYDPETDRFCRGKYFFRFDKKYGAYCLYNFDTQRRAYKELGQMFFGMYVPVICGLQKVPIDPHPFAKYTDRYFESEGLTKITPDHPDYNKYRYEVGLPPVNLDSVTRDEIFLDEIWVRIKKEEV